MARRICAQLGATTYDLAIVFGVSKSTVDLWKVQHPDFSEALSAGKAVYDDAMAESFRTRAMGYDYPSETKQVTKERLRGRLIAVKEVVTSKVEHVPGDAGAALSWLKNRRPKEWREKTDAGVEVNVNFSPEISRMIAMNKRLISDDAVEATVLPEADKVE